MTADQLTFEFDDHGAGPRAHDISLWSPREVFVHFNTSLVDSLREDRRIEYKTTPKVNFDDLAAYYSAFSNTQEGGVICIGVSDKGNLVGSNCLSQSQLNDIEKFHRQRCPEAKPEIKRVQFDNDGTPDFVILIFLPYRSKLVETNKDEAWVRFGDSKIKMSEEEKRDFRSTRNETSFELDEASYNFPEDFDPSIIKDFCDSFRRIEGREKWSNDEVLIDRHLAKRVDGIIRPLNSLVLLAGRDVSKSIPGCRVRVQRFETKDEGYGETYNPIRDRFAEGNLVAIIQRASELVEEALHDVTWLNNDGKFVTTPEYPRWAWFEALVNACVHRSYNFSGTETTVKIYPNRMVIESPGGFVPPVNETTIYSARASRNHHTMDAMRYLGYVRMAREGTRRMKQSMIEYNLPEPSFKQEVVHGVVVKVTLLNDHEAHKRSRDGDVAKFVGVDKWKLLQDHEIKITAYAFRNGSIQVSEAQRQTGRTWATSKKDLERLCRKGILVFVPGQYPRDPKAHYKIVDNESRET